MGRLRYRLAQEVYCNTSTGVPVPSAPSWRDLHPLQDGFSVTLTPLTGLSHARFINVRWFGIDSEQCDLRLLL